MSSFFDWQNLDRQIRGKVLQDDNVAGPARHIGHELSRTWPITGVTTRTATPISSILSRGVPAVLSLGTRSATPEQARS